MRYKIGNGIIEAEIDETGGQLMSVRTVKDGHEYLWQGDKKYWTGRAYNLFPVIGRMYGGQYDYRGKTYDMPMHGLIRKACLRVCPQSETEISFVYTENENTLPLYPFPFVYRLTFSVKGNVLSVRTAVENTGKDVLPFGVGGHPGFFVPMEEGLTFEDYYVEFDRAEEVRTCVMSDDVLFTGKTEPYPLNDKRLPLRHELFPVDALVLVGTGGRATIRSDKGSRSVTMNYPDMKYMGLWHKPNSDAPYLCLEPWSMLPASVEGRDDFATKPDMVRLLAGETYENEWTLEIK